MSSPSGTARSRHWDAIYQTRGADAVSWAQPEPVMALEMIDDLSLTSADPIIDIGGGASTLVDRLLERGHTDLTVLDVSVHALSLAKHRLGGDAERVHWETADLLQWSPPRCFALWYDRAVFHFLTDSADLARYRDLATTSIEPGAHLIMGTFAADGPERCSGLSVARYSPDQLAAEFAAGFTSVAARREHHYTPTGVDQPFTWLVLRRTHSAPC